MKVFKTRAAVAFSLLSLVCVSLTLTGAAEPTTKPGGFKSADANLALRKFDLAEAKAKVEYDKAVAAARGEMITELEAAKDKATKAGDLDEAVKLRDMVNDLKAADKPVKAVDDKTGFNVVGDWVVNSAPNFKGTMRVFENGTAKYLDNPNNTFEMKWSIADGKLVIRTNAVSRDIYTIGNSMVGVNTSNKQTITAVRVGK